jgi:hypothetical protein
LTQVAQDSRNPFLRLLVPVWLLTAAWDFGCASALSIFGYHSTFTRLWQGVAATVLGPTAIGGGTSTVLAGLALHLAVALTWSALFVLAAVRWSGLRNMIATRGGALAVAIAYGPLIWLVMSLVVIPLALHRPPAFGARWWTQVGAHVPFVSIPLVFMARHVLRREPRVSAGAVGDRAA